MTKSESRALLIANGVPDELLGRDADVSFLRRMGMSAPNICLAEEIEQAVPNLRGFIPIFEVNGEALIGYVSRNGRFVRFYYEDTLAGDDAIELLGVGYQQFAAKLLIELYEAGLSSHFDTFVGILRFVRAHELRTLLEASTYDEQAVNDFYLSLAVEKAP